MKPVRSFALLVLGLGVAAINAQEPPEILPGSVNDIMVTIITPATNTIWGIEDPQTKEDWQVYVDAAAQLVDAATRIKSGGAGPNDSSWAGNPEWQQFADVLIESGLEIQEAARKGDLETVIIVSNDKMYPPCEECHIMFHPGVEEQEVN
jgi:hypothetical protein